VRLSGKLGYVVTGAIGVVRGGLVANTSISMNKHIQNNGQQAVKATLQAALLIVQAQDPTGEQDLSLHYNNCVMRYRNGL
jgi:hypothetical protein